MSAKLFHVNGFDFSDKEPEVPDEDLTFLSSWSAGTDLTALRERTLSVWRESKEKYHVYKCVEKLAFLQPSINEHPSYRTILNAFATSASRHLPPPRIIDIGCCYGTDVRRLILDSIPPSSITAIDLHDGYWNLGKKLFADGDEGRIEHVRTFFGNMAVPFDETKQDGDVIDEAGLRGTVDFVSAMLVLHVFSKEQVEQFLKRVYRCLAPGGLFLGISVGAAQEAVWRRVNGQAVSAGPSQTRGEHEAPPPPRYLHTPASLTTVLEQIGFVKVKVTTDMHLMASDLVQDNRMMRLIFSAEKEDPEWAHC